MLARKGSELPSQKVQAAIPSPEPEPVPDHVVAPLPEVGLEPDDDGNIIQAALERARRLREEQARDNDKP